MSNNNDNASTILYIEDFPVVQDIYVKVLREHGFNIEVASDGKEALDLVGQKDYDIILLDLLLPELSGMDFLRKFRAENHKGRVVILTDFDDPKIMQEAKDLGIEEYWIKAENTPYVLSERLDTLIAELGLDSKKE